MMQRNFVDMEKMLDLFQENIEVQDLPDAAPFSIGPGTVKFGKCNAPLLEKAIGLSLSICLFPENVSFAYDSRQPILKNISFTVPGGSTVALVGFV
jgi:ATP-binding cassette subfamily B (MDR/TAP) protein 6